MNEQPPLNEQPTPKYNNLTEKQIEYFRNEALKILNLIHRHALEENLKYCSNKIFEMFHRFPTPDTVEEITREWIVSRIIKGENTPVNEPTETGFPDVDLRDMTRYLFFATLDSINVSMGTPPSDDLTPDEAKELWETFMRESITHQGGVWSALAGEHQWEKWQERLAPHQANPETFSQN